MISTKKNLKRSNILKNITFLKKLHNFSFPVTVCIYVNTEYWLENSFKVKGKKRNFSYTYQLPPDKSCLKIKIKQANHVAQVILHFIGFFISFFEEKLKLKANIKGQVLFPKNINSCAVHLIYTRFLKMCSFISQMSQNAIPFYTIAHICGRIRQWEVHFPKHLVCITFRLDLICAVDNRVTFL